MIKKTFFFFPIAVLLAAGAGFCTNAQAEASRTWVSGVGDDANPCSRTAPCKTFAGAISKTMAGGEIDVLDPGGFGAVTITKSITIDGGSFASILAFGSNGIYVNAAPGDTVTIRNLSINGVNGNGLNGIIYINGGILHVENVEIFGFSLKGIDFEPTSNSQLFVKDSFIRKNISGGILIKPYLGVTAKASISNVRMESNQTGLRAEDRSSVSIQDCVAAGNTNSGLVLYSTTDAVNLNVAACLISNNGATASAAGIKSEGTTSTVTVTDSLISNNSVGLLSVSSGKILSFGDNRIYGNTITDGAPTGMLTQN